MLKASAGGGGRGMRFVENIDQIENAFNTAQSESEIAFGNSDLYLEKFIEKKKTMCKEVFEKRWDECSFFF